MGAVVFPTWLLRQTVQVEALIGNTAYGPKYGQPFELRARVEWRRRKITNRQGEEVISEATAYLAPSSPTLKPGDRVTVDGQRCTVEEVRNHVDGTGRLVYVEVLLR